MPVLAEELDEVQIASPTGMPIATVSISNDRAGQADLLTRITMHVPGPCLAVLGEGSNSYAAESAYAVVAVVLMVIERDQPTGDQCRDKRQGKRPSNPIDVHFADLTVSYPGVDRLPAFGATTGHDTLRILLSARQDLTTTTTKQGNQLRALLLAGDDTDRKIARGTLNEVTLASLARRHEPRDVSCGHSVRHVEIRRLALSLFVASRALKANTMQLQAIVDDLAPGLTERRGIGPVGAAQAIVSLSYPSALPKQRGARAVRS